MKRTIVSVLAIVFIIGLVFTSMSTVQPVPAEAQQPTSTRKPLPAWSPDNVMNSAGTYTWNPDIWKEVGATGKYSVLGNCYASWKVLGTAAGTAFYQDWVQNSNYFVGSPFTLDVMGGNAGSAFYEGKFKIKLSWYDNTGAIYATNERTNLNWSGGTSGCQGTQHWYLTGTVPSPGAGKTLQKVRIIFSHYAADGKQVPFTFGELKLG